VRESLAEAHKARRHGHAVSDARDRSSSALAIWPTIGEGASRIFRTLHNHINLPAVRFDPSRDPDHPCFAGVSYIAAMQQDWSFRSEAFVAAFAAQANTQIFGRDAQRQTCTHYRQRGDC
jgi:hypothetical protein